MTYNEQLEQLDLQYKNYCMLSIDEAKEVNNKTYNNLGISFTELYNLTRSSIIDEMILAESESGNDTNILSEAFSLPHEVENRWTEEELDSANVEEHSASLEKKIAYAKSIASDTMIIITPITTENVYGLDELEAMFNRFNRLSSDLKKICDQESKGLFGKDVRYMYNVNKVRLQNLIDKGKLPETDDDNSSGSDEASIEESTAFICNDKNTSIIDLLNKKMQMIYDNKYGDISINESVCLEDAIDMVDNATEDDTVVPEFVPYLTPTEIEQHMSDGLSDDTRKFLENYKKSLLNGLRDFDSKGYFKTIKSIYEEKVQKKFQPYIIEKTLLGQGWNPNLPFNKHSFDTARERIRKYIKEYYTATIVPINIGAIKEEDELDTESINPECIYFVDITNGSKFITFDYTFRKLYGAMDNVMSIDAIDKESEMTLYAVKVSTGMKNDIMSNICNDQWRSMHKGMFTDVFLKGEDPNSRVLKFCAIIAEAAKCEINSLPVVYKLYHGRKGSCSRTDIKMKTAILFKDRSISMDITPKDAVKMANSGETLKEHYRCKDKDINAILEQMNALYTPKCVLSEAKPIPIRINDKGMTVDLPSIIEEEYQRLHKTLVAMDEAGNYEGMKEPLANLWYLNLMCDRKITKWKGNEKKAAQLKIKKDQRARILNDFKKYLKKVMTADPSFNFTDYFEKSKYNDRSLFVDMDTIKYTGKIVKAIVSSVIKK